MSPDKELAVISQSGQSFSFFDLQTFERTSVIKDLICEPHEIAHDTKRNCFYVSHTYNSGSYYKKAGRAQDISVIDLATRQLSVTIRLPAGCGPHGLKLDPKQDILYASVERVNEDEGGVIGIDLNKRQVIKTISTGAVRSHWIVLTPDGKKAYTSNKEAPFVSVINLETETTIGQIRVPGCEELDLAADGLLYIPTPAFAPGANTENAGLHVVDTKDDREIDFIKTGHGILSVHVTARNTIMVGQYIQGKSLEGAQLGLKGGRLSLYDGGNYRHLGSVDLGTPLTMRSSSDGLTGFVAEYSQRYRYGNRSGIHAGAEGCRGRFRAEER